MQTTFRLGRFGIPSLSVPSQMPHVLPVRRPVQRGLSEVTGSRFWGWTQLFSYCRVRELLPSLADATWTVQG